MNLELPGFMQAYGFRTGVHNMGTIYDRGDFMSPYRKFEIKEVKFNPDSVETVGQLKWNDNYILRSEQYGPQVLKPRFGCEGDFYLTGRGGREKLIEGKINKAGDIVELSKFDLDAIKQDKSFQKDFKVVGRILKKVAKFIMK